MLWRCGLIIDARTGLARVGDVIAPVGSPLLLAASRATMECSRLQARLALGPETCAELDAMAADPATPWAMRQTLLYAQTWQRLHPSMDEIGWALGYDAYQIDALFMLASTL